MGGFGFESATSDGASLPGSIERLSMTPMGLCFLIHVAPDMIPDMSIEDIQDKSNSNTLGKTVTCLQALWFCVHLVARLCNHLPLTLLELNTFSHAVCAFVIFGLWWQKPHDVERATVLTHSEARNLCSAMIAADLLNTEKTFHIKIARERRLVKKEVSFTPRLSYCDAADNDPESDQLAFEEPDTSPLSERDALMVLQLEDLLPYQ